MLSYKFTKGAFQDDKNVSFHEDEEYLLQLKSLQDTMKAIRQMEQESPKNKPEIDEEAYKPLEKSEL